MTLIEVLVVLAVTSTLSLLGATTAGDILSRTRLAICANNLARIGQVPGIQMREFERGRQAAFTDTTHWILSALKETNEKGILRCPEGGREFTLSDPVPGAPAPWMTTNMCIEINPDNCDANSFWMQTPCGVIERNSMVYYSGPAGIVKVKPQGPTTITINGQLVGLDITQASTITSANMTVELRNTSKNGKAMGQWEILIAATDATIVPEPPSASAARDAQEAAIEAAKPRYFVSYGMNPTVASGATLRSGNILAMDYSELVVQTSDPQWSAPDYSFARHRGLLNVLFRDGTVRQLSPQNLDPTLPENAREYWQP
ncbi:MAG: hypothetical protein ABFD92_13940 [Planctomycetaceae bacterium]|nr:hypothetical protein [Planctomycetaceae bacterium]